MSQIDNTIVK